MPQPVAHPTHIVPWHAGTQDCRMATKTDSRLAYLLEIPFDSIDDHRRLPKGVKIDPCGIAFDPADCFKNVIQRLAWRPKRQALPRAQIAPVCQVSACRPSKGPPWHREFRSIVLRSRQPQTERSAYS